MYSDCTDEELLRAFRRGDNDAFEAVVARYQDVVYRLALRQIHHREGAEDVVQEVFFRAFKKLKRWSFRRGKPFTWLYRTTRNVCSEFRREAHRYPLLSADFGRERIVANVEIAQTDHEETRRCVQRLVQHLPPRQEEVVILHVYEELRLQDVADVLGIPVGTVKSNYHKALINLRRMIAASESRDYRVRNTSMGTGT
jgi:RNA polymerase sigma-70 factor (ECF subfamily)